MGGTSAPKVANVPGVLKAFVITTGIMLVIGAIALTVLIMLKANRNGDSEAVSAKASPIDLELPSGTRVHQVIVDGKRLVLLAEDQGGQQYLAVVDAISGARLSLIRITPSP